MAKRSRRGVNLFGRDQARNLPVRIQPLPALGFCIRIHSATETGTFSLNHSSMSMHEAVVCNEADLVKTALWPEKNGEGLYDREYHDQRRHDSCSPTCCAR